MEIPVDMIANYGVPTVIAIYLVWWVTKSLNGQLKELKQSIDSLNRSIQRLVEEVSRE